MGHPIFLPGQVIASDKYMGTIIFAQKWKDDGDQGVWTYHLQRTNTEIAPKITEDRVIAIYNDETGSWEKVGE